MKDKLELDPTILTKNLEITKLTQQIDKLISDNVDLKEQLKTKDDLLTMSELSKKELKSENVNLKESIIRIKEMKEKSKFNDKELHFLLNEVHERMYPMMEWCERLKPVKLDIDPESELVKTPITVDITDEEEMKITKLFRLVELPEEMTSYDDQTSRSILKDLRKVIKSLEK
tara:strand:+ start:34 stop:552 length:519 start_codon:yes stop_codon:yes gene_type:complete